eukprot:sb/3470951/
MEKITNSLFDLPLIDVCGISGVCVSNDLTRNSLKLEYCVLYLLREILNFQESQSDPDLPGFNVRPGDLKGIFLVNRGPVNRVTRLPVWQPVGSEVGGNKGTNLLTSSRWIIRVLIQPPSQQDLEHIQCLCRVDLFREELIFYETTFQHRAWGPTLKSKVRFKRLDQKFLEIGVLRVVFTKRDPEFPGISGQVV